MRRLVCSPPVLMRAHACVHQPPFAGVEPPEEQSGDFVWCVRTGAILLGSGVVGGYCVYGLASFLYYAIYPPVRPHTPAAEGTANQLALRGALGIAILFGR